MKALFLALLLVNLIVLAWTQWHAPAEPRVAAPAESAVPTLQLAGEVSKDDEPVVAPSEAPHTAAPPPAAEPRPDSAPSPEQSAALINGVARCISLGPFRDLAEAQHWALSRLGATEHPPSL